MVTFGLVAVAVVCAVVGIVYLTITAPHLPSLVPGAVKYRKHARHFTKRRVGLVFAAAVALVGAWYSSSTRRRRLRYR